MIACPHCGRAWHQGACAPLLSVVQARVLRYLVGRLGSAGIRAIRGNCHAGLGTCMSLERLGLIERDPRYRGRGWRVTAAGREAIRSNQ